MKLLRLSSQELFVNDDIMQKGDESKAKKAFFSYFFWVFDTDNRVFYTCCFAGKTYKISDGDVPETIMGGVCCERACESISKQSCPGVPFVESSPIDRLRLGLCYSYLHSFGRNCIIDGQFSETTTN